MKGCKQYFLLLCFLPWFFVNGYSQQYSNRDQEEIAYQAQLTLSMFNDMLNVISYKGLATESEIDRLIRDSYTDSRSQIFYSENAIVEDDINPSQLVQQNRQDKTIKEYLNYFDLAYEKADSATIEFKNFQASPLKYSRYLYIQVKYTSQFKGKHKEDTTPYTAVDRIAEFKAEKRENKWKTFIISIVYASRENSFFEEKDNVALVDKENRRVSLSSFKNNINTNSGVPSAGSDQDTLFIRSFEAGKKALKEGALEEAFELLSEAEKFNPYHHGLREKLLELAKAQNIRMGSPERQFEYLKNKADKAYASRDYSKAKSLYTEALMLKPGDEQVKVSIEKMERLIRKLAILESKFAAGEYKEAIKDYNKVIRKEKDNADYYFGRGKAYEQLGNLEKAFYDYSNAIKIDNHFIEARNRRARIYIQTGQLHQALADYTLILSYPEYAAAYYPERAKVKKMLGNWTGAIEDYKAAIALRPGLAEPYFEIGMIHTKQENLKQAVPFFSEAIKRDPQHVLAYFYRGMAYSATEELRSASADFETARELGLKEAQINQINEVVLNYYKRAEGAVVEKRYNRALTSFRQALLLSPTFGRAWLRAGDVFFQLQEYDSSIIYYNKALEYDPLSFAYFKRGLALQQKEEDQSAFNDFKRFIPIGREILAETGKKDMGNGGFSFQNSFREERADALYALGYAQLMTHQPLEALDNFNMAIRHRKFFPKAYFARGSAFYVLEDYKRAIKNMEESIKMGLSEPVIFFSLGKAYIANGQLEDALMSYAHAIKLDPQYEDAYLERAVCYKELGQYGAALEDIKFSLSLDESLKRESMLLTRKGLLELYLNMLQQANNSFDQALQLNEHDGWALYGKACALVQEHKIEESLDYYKRAFQSGQVEWSAIKKDALIRQVSKHKKFKELVNNYF